MGYTMRMGHLDGIYYAHGPPRWDILCAWATWMGYTMRMGHLDGIHYAHGPPGWDTLCAWAIWMGYTMRIGHMVVGSLYMYGTCAFGMWDRCGIHPYVWDQEGRVGGAVW